MRRPAYHKLLRRSSKVEKYLGSLEVSIMELLWDRGEASVRDVVGPAPGVWPAEPRVLQCDKLQDIVMHQAVGESGVKL